MKTPDEEYIDGYLEKGNDCYPLYFENGNVYRLHDRIFYEKTPIENISEEYKKKLIQIRLEQ